MTTTVCNSGRLEDARLTPMPQPLGEQPPGVDGALLRAGEGRDDAVLVWNGIVALAVAPALVLDPTSLRPRR